MLVIQSIACAACGALGAQICSSAAPPTLRKLIVALMLLYMVLMLLVAAISAMVLWGKLREWDSEATLGANGIKVNLGRTQAEFMERVRERRYEYLGVFTQTGRTIYATTSLCTTSVYHAQDEPQLRRGRPYCVAVHNHPGKVESAFSGNDVAALLKYRFNETIVVTRRRTYRLIYAGIGKPPERSAEEVAQAKAELRQATNAYLERLEAAEPLEADELWSAEGEVRLGVSRRRELFSLGGGNTNEKVRSEVSRRQELFRQATVLASQEFAQKYGFRFVEEEMC